MVSKGNHPTEKTSILQQAIQGSMGDLERSLDSQDKQDVQKSHTFAGLVQNNQDIKDHLKFKMNQESNYQKRKRGCLIPDQDEIDI